mgnify:CR=1 FL=1
MTEAFTIRRDWTVDEVVAIHDQPFLSLMDRARNVHRAHHVDGEIDRDGHHPAEAHEVEQARPEGDLPGPVAEHLSDLWTQGPRS